MRLELGQRAFNRTEDVPAELRGEAYYNRLHELDDECGDLSDLIDWATAKGVDYELIDGKLLLDFYVYDKEELRDNLLIEFDEQGEIIQAYLTGNMEDDKIRNWKEIASA